MPLKPWKILSSKHIYKNVRIDQCELSGGKIIEGFVLDFENDWVTIVALTSDQNVVMERQYRHGIQKTILELPGGVMDAEDASPLEAAKRELQEETGYSSDHFIEIGAVSPNPANHTNTIHYFLALDVTKVSAQHLDETEEIELKLMPLEEVIRMAKEGELIHTMQVSAIFFALAHLNRIG
jgi:ADP-ribose pyrophosphatase